MNIQYESRGDILYVQFCGLLDALDLIFLYLDEDYKKHQQHHNKILYDFSQISGSKLSKEDAQGLALLRKREKNVSKHLVILVSGQASIPIAEGFASIMANSNYQVDICTSLHDSERLLKD